MCFTSLKVQMARLGNKGEQYWELYWEHCHGTKTWNQKFSNFPPWKEKKNGQCGRHWLRKTLSNGAFTLDVKSVLNENLGGILGGTQC